jgi:serine/threonine protein phosphatase PrpC
MEIGVAAASERGSGCAANTAAFSLVEHASVYTLACGAGDTARSAEDARQVLDTVRHGFADVHAAPHVADARSQLDAVSRLYAGALVANHALHEAQRADDWAGVSFVGVAIRGPNLCIMHSGGARAYRFQREGFEQLTDQARAVRSSTPALGLVPRVAVEPFLGSWEPGAIVALTSDSLVSDLQPGPIARALLEAGSLDKAAAQIVKHMNEARGQDSAAAVLIRWSGEDERLPL